MLLPALQDLPMLLALLWCNVCYAAGNVAKLLLLH